MGLTPLVMLVLALSRGRELRRVGSQKLSEGRMFSWLETMIGLICPCDTFLSYNRNVQ